MTSATGQVDAGSRGMRRGLETLNLPFAKIEDSSADGKPTWRMRGRMFYMRPERKTCWSQSSNLQEEGFMKFNRTRSVVLGGMLAGSLIAVVPVYAADDSGWRGWWNRSEVRQDRQEVESDKRELRQDRKELLNDRRELRRDLRQGAGPDEIAGDLRERRDDRGELRRDRQELKQDRRELQRDRR